MSITGWFWCTKCRGNNVHKIHLGQSICNCGYKHKVNAREKTIESPSSKDCNTKKICEQLRSTNVGTAKTNGHRIIGNRSYSVGNIHREVRGRRILP